ncbi:MAG: ATP-binding protein [Spirochaeta sp.]|jgi:two-component sensor histidine kinase|nr:ATP-binding protein [Spirochaeta sp.]
MARLIHDRTAQLQDTNALLATTQEIAHLGSWEFVPQTRTIRCSEEVYRIIGVPTITGTITLNRAMRAIGTADRRQFLRTFLESVRTGAPGFEMVHRVIRADTGAHRWVLQRCIHRRDPNGRVIWTRGMVHDISDRHQIEESLRFALAEKSVLLQEVNHRVRNNLAVVQSILSLQRGYLPPESRAYGVLTDAGNRIASMSIIHDQLYNTNNAAIIVLSDYIETLLSRIRESYAIPGIELQSEVDSLTIDVTRAISCGLIVNELVVNAYKHAFPSGSGTISVVAGRAGQDIEIVVTDDGAGQKVRSAPNEERPTTGGLGRELVDQLAAQIGGTVTYQSEPGTRVVVRFPASEPVPA